MATRMAESKGPVPHFYISSEVDASACAEGRAALKRAGGEDGLVPTFNDMVVKACGLALREFPQANAAYRDGSFELYSRVNVGIAVAAGEALFVPTIFDADRKGLREIATESRALAQRAGEGTISPAEMSGGTFTVSNLGMYGIQIVTPVITAGQAAILGVGAITERAVARDGELATIQQMTLTLAGDHRILTGVAGAELLSRIRVLLEQPLGLAL
jgi:pyruvate dehydrogenase E2 component (dihydrolipoamide acetyltransferase)